MTSLFYDVPLGAFCSRSEFWIYKLQGTKYWTDSMRAFLTPSFLLVWILGSLSVCHAFVPSVHFPGNPTSLSVAPESPSQLQMSNGYFLDRLTRVVKSNVNKWVSNIENPEKVINQAVNEMQVRDSLNC
jgi:hypothetical protein